jgi:hypothetical protein
MINHITKEQFWSELFGLDGRNFGNPEQWFTDNPSDIFPFIENCTINRLPAFMSIQPMKSHTEPVGIEKVFFDFDCVNETFLKQLSSQEPNITKRQAIIEQRRLEMINEVKFFVQNLNKTNIRPLLVRTSKGYHVHIYFDNVYVLDTNSDYCNAVYIQIQQNFLSSHNYMYADKTVLGNLRKMCRIPLSIHQKTGEECIIVNNQLRPDKIRSIEYYKLYGLKKADITLAIKKVREVKKSVKAKTYQRTEGKSINSSNAIRPCFQKAIHYHEMCHAQRLALLLEAYCAGYEDQQSLIDFFRYFNDFDESKTRYQVDYFFKNSVSKGQVRPYKCKTIEEKGWCLSEECPLFRKRTY